MLRATTEFVRDRLRQRRDLIPLGYAWSFVVTVDISVLLVTLISTLQRPASDLLPSSAAVPQLTELSALRALSEAT